MSMIFSPEDVLSILEFEGEIIGSPYNDSFNVTYADDKPGLNFNHKLRDFEEFTTSAQHFRDFGRYTNYPPNSYSRSRFMQFWKEEKRRCLEGYNIGRDWIPGYYYWYLNYQRIERVYYAKKDVYKFLIGEKVRGDRKEDFPLAWDYDYYTFHYFEEAEKRGLHANVLKSRGKGFSSKGGSMCNRNYFLIPKSKSYVIAHESGYLDGVDGILSRAYDSKEFINANTAFFKYSHKKNRSIHYRASKISYDNYGKELELGSKAEVIGIPLKGDIGRARGKRGKLILWEEYGNFPNGLEGWNIARESVEQDGVVFGLMVSFGTAGSEQKSFKNLKEMHLKPEAYGVLGLTNIWSEKPNSKKCSLFIPSYTNLNGLMDKDGNTNIALGYKIETNRLDKLRASKAEPDTITQFKLERPRRPEDALLKKGSNGFPVNLLNTVLTELELEQETSDYRYIGLMGIDADGKVVFLESDKVNPVDSFPHDKTNDNSGAIVIYQKPSIKNGKALSGIYIAGGDPYDQNKSSTDSLGSTYIMNSITGELVAEYVGRPERAETYWEQTRLLLLYYDARINHENDLVGFRNHCFKMGSGYLFVATPTVVLSILKTSSVERGEGTHATTKTNKHARTLIANYLTERIDDKSELTYAHTIKSIPLLQELIGWDIDGNYDRVSSLGMLMILYEEYNTYGLSKKGNNEEEKTEDDKYWDSLFGEGEQFDFEN